MSVFPYEPGAWPNMRDLVAGFLLVTYMAMASSSENGISSNSDHAIESVNSSLSYEVECINYKYAIAIGKRNDVTLVVNGINYSESFKTSALAELISRKELIGRIGFSCYKTALNINFLGLNLSSEDPRQAVEYRGIISNDGQVQSTSGVLPIPLPMVKEILLRKR